MSFHTALIQKRGIQSHRSDGRSAGEFPVIRDIYSRFQYAANMKGGGEAYLMFEVTPKSLPKKGTRFPLPNGTKIRCFSHDRYKIEAQLHKNVFVVRSHRTARLYAMKIEWLSDREVFCLTDLLPQSERNKRFLPRLLNKGRVTNHFNFIVYTLCSYNLNDTRVIIMNNNDFTKSDAARLSVQTFQAVHDLHRIGYYHRNISPSKFCIGLNKNNYVYMIDFSHSFRFHKVSKTSPPVVFKLSKRKFQARTKHRGQLYQRKDDLESWLYVCFDLFGRHLLPWHEAFTDMNLLAYKERFFANGSDVNVYQHVPRQFTAIMHQIEKEHPDDRPDYVFIATTLMSIKETIDFRFSTYYDFQKKDGKIVELNNEEETLIIPDAKDVIFAPSTKTSKNKKNFAGNEQEDAFQKTDVTAPSASKASVQIAEPPKPVLTTPIRFTGKVEAKNSPFQYPKQPPKPDAAYVNLVINGNKVIEQGPPPAVNTPPISPSPFSPTSPSNPTSPSPNASPVADPIANVDPFQVEKDRVSREKKELEAKLNAAKMGQSKDELEKMRREKEELAAKLAALQDGKNDQERLERERREKQELENKLKNMEEEMRLERERKEKEKLAAKFEEIKKNQIKEELEKERREKAELEAKIAQIEAQKKLDAEAEAAKIRFFHFSIP
ncbi:Protein kinase domain-containing protein [Aphelenchoides besseyi]|nr:Protein kinase domain-containing protein [Aphelenchoides besseyi]